MIKGINFTGRPTLRRWIFVLLGWVWIGTSLPAAAQSDDLAAGFAAPPDAYAPHTWWDWINGNVTKEGVTADLEAMQRVGIRSATIVILTGGPVGPIHYATPEFIEMVKFAASEAKRLGLTLGLENCTGWSSSGAPWVTPENSMLTVVSSEKNLQGPMSFSDLLEQPATRRNFYRDIRVVAFPAVDGGDADMTAAAPTVTANAADFHDSKSATGYLLPYATNGSLPYLQFEFAQPFAARTLQIETAPSTEAVGDVQSSDDGQSFRTVRSFSVHQRAPFREPDLGEIETLALPPTSARFYRVVFHMSKGPGKAMPISRLQFLTGARLDEFLGKSDGTEQKIMQGAEYENLVTPVPPDNLIVHSNQIVDLTSKMDGAGKLTWDVPAGKWTVLRVGYTTTGVSNHPGPPDGTGLECGKLSRAAGKAFWDGLMNKVTQDLGPLTGTGFTHTLIDSYEVGNQNWTPEMPREFQKRCGYDLLAYLPVLAGYVVDGVDQSDRVLWDLRHTVANLFAENYYDYFAELSHESGIKIEVEPYGNGPFDAVRSGATADRVMGEFWWPSGGMGSLRIAASAAHTRGKALVGAESFTSDLGAWQMSPPTMKALGDLAFTDGINGFTFHRYTMQRWLNRYPGMAMGHNGSNIERTETWWEQGKAWMQYLARCQFLLRQGVFAADALFFEGEAAPTEPDRPDESVLPRGYDFDWADTDVILHRLSVQNGKLTLPEGGSYRVLVLPSWAKKMTPELLRKLKELADAGATIIGPKPEQSPSLGGYPGCDDEVKKLAADLWDGGKIVDHPLPEVLAGLKLPRDFEPADPNVKLAYIHRRLGDGDLYFVSNQSDTTQECDCLFRVSGKAPELWHGDTGEIEKVAAYSDEDGRTRVPLRLGPAGSIFVLFRGPAPADHPASLARTDQGASTSTETLTINQATFGAEEGTPSADVTAKLASLIQNGSLHVEAISNNLGGDPAPGLRKELRVDYTLDGQAGSKTVPEGRQLDLAKPKPLFPDAQLHAGADGSTTLEAWQNGAYAVKMTDGQTKTVPVTGLAAPMEVDGPWTLSFPPNEGAPDQATFDHLISWSDSTETGIKYFSGTATYTKTLSLPADLLGAGHHLYLDLGDVQVIAEVSLNGHDLGILWKPPYFADLAGAAQAGDNKLVVKVTNLWPNRIIGDQQLPEDSPDRDANGWLLSWPQWLIDGKPSPTGRITFSTWRHWKKSDPLFPSGLIGPVMLRPTVDLAVP